MQSNAGVVLQALSEHSLSLRLLSQAQTSAAKTFGSTHIQNGQALHQLTQAHFLSGDIPSALATSQEALVIFTQRLGEDHIQTREVRKNVELLKAVVENVERQKAVRDRGLERIRAVVGSSRKRLAAGSAAPNESGMNRANANLGNLAAINGPGLPSVNNSISGVSGMNGLGGGMVEEVSRIGERGHLDVDELVKFIQGPSKSTRGKNSLRGKRRTGAKR